uniref:CRAL-TRIO domain-containing protein n=1 Tax=Heterorhabditis bacteriophora TaxID=37862 RepID=A0A1I7XQF3_HETBA
MKAVNVYNIRDESDSSIILQQMLRTLREVPSGEHSLSPQELCSFDDMATTLVVDSVLNFQTHKMHLRRRYIKQDERILGMSIMREFRETQDFIQALSHFFCLRSVKSFLAHMTVHKQLGFRDHVMRFLNIFSSKAGFTIKPCNRYTAEHNQGAKLVATKHWFVITDYLRIAEHILLQVFIFKMDIVPDNLEFDDDTKYVRRRRVSFHNVKTVQNYDKDNFDLLDGSPFREKIHETMSSDGVLTPGRSHTRMSISSVSTTTPCPTPVNKISDDGDDTMLLLYGFSDTVNGKSMQFEDINATRNICVDMSVCDTNITEASCIENEDNTIVLFDRAGKVSDENIVANHINSIASESTMNIFRGQMCIVS